MLIRGHNRYGRGRGTDDRRVGHREVEETFQDMGQVQGDQVMEEQ